jgi:hypothetical protein
MVASGDEINASDITDLEDLTIRRPFVRLVQATIQSIPDAVGTALTFTTEDEDLLSFHDPVTNNTRITPTIAGWYRFYGTYFSATLTTPALFACYMRKNGTTIPPGNRVTYNAATVSPGVNCTAAISMNGTSDYVEFVALQDSAGATNTAISAYIASTFECEYIKEN